MTGRYFGFGLMMIQVVVTSILAAKPLYFPTTDVDMTLAGIRGKLLDSDETIYAARTYSKPTQLKRDIIIYKSKNLPINFLFNNNTGDIKITKDFFLHVNESEVFRINIEAFDSIDPKRAASFQMKINIKLITGEKLKCVDYLTQLCFWNDAKYQVLENQATSFLGVLSSLYYKKLCKDYSISYSILKGPNKNKLKIEQNQFSKTWYLLTNMYLDRDADSSGPHFDVNVACGIQDGRNQHRIISKMVNVTVLDEDDSPVIPQVRPVVEVCLTSKEVRKGEELTFSESLLFNDDDSAYVNHYETQILEDTENVIDLDCKKIDIDILKKTGLYCEMKFKRHYKFKQLPYTTMLQVTDTSLEHNDNRTVIVTIQIKLCKTNSIMEHHTTKPTRGDMYPYIETKILRLAGPFSRVAQPAEEIKNLQSYRFKIIYDSSIKNGRSAFGITEKDGIIYVLNMDLLQNKSLKNVDLIVEWWLDGAKNSLKVSHQQPVGRGSDPLRIIIVDELTETCNQVGTNIDSWPMCASFDSVKKCHEACGVATGGYNTLKHIDRVTQRSTRCTWRGNVTKSTFMTNDYQTCTPDITTCPDTKCDELEKLHSGICPQDCTDEEVLWGEHNLHTNRGIAKGNGVCTCEGSCVCGNFGLSNDGVKVAGAAGKHHKKKTLTADIGTQTENEILNVHKAEPVNACGPLCLSSLGLGIICVLIIFTLILCQCRSWQSLGSREHKYISSVTALSHGYGKEYVQQTPINPPAQPLTSNLNSNGIHNGLEFNFTMNVSLNKKYTPDPKWEFPRSNLHIEQILGEGEFGRVLKARALDIGGNLGYSTVAVKTLKENAQNSELDDLISEYELLKEVSHPNVIRLLGVSMSAGGPAYLIIEYAELGSLRNYLRKSRNLECENSKMHDYNIVPSATEVCKVTARDILSFAWQISKGMAYLGDKKLVHRDLAARNVLVAAGKICKISDFGLTRDVYEDNAYLKRSKGRVPIKWMAPESLADHVYTNRSDVWSFGILLWELITLGGSPYPGIAVENLFTLLRSGYRMEKPPNCSIQLYTVMQKCWEIDPTERPSFRSLTEKFENLLEDGVNYLNLDLHAVQNKAYFTTLNETSDGSKQLNIPKYSNGDPFVMNLLQTQANTKCAEFNKLPIWQVSSPTASGGVPMINYQNEDRRLSSHYEVPKNNNLTKTADNLVESNKMHLSYIDMSQTKNVEEKPLLIKSTRSYDQLPSQRITNV